MTRLSNWHRHRRRALGAICLVLALIGIWQMWLRWSVISRWLTGESIMTAAAILGATVVPLLATRQLQISKRTLIINKQILVQMEDESAHRKAESRVRAIEWISDKLTAGPRELDRLARSDPDERPFVVEVLCDTLRMPFKAPGEMVDVDAGSDEYVQWKRDLEFRIVAQRVLAKQLRLEPDGSIVPGDTSFHPDIDLKDAVLIDFDLSRCRCRNGWFDGARFEGDADFSAAAFTGTVRFKKTKFTRDALFGDVEFLGRVVFAHAEFARYAKFHKAIFDAQADFSKTEFGGFVVFDNTSFANNAIFDGARFISDTGFIGTRFVGEAGFANAVFTRDATFDQVVFDGEVAFGGAKFAEGIPMEVARFLVGSGSSAAVEPTVDEAGPI